MNSAITKVENAFTATGDMWSALYDARFDEETRSDMILTEMKLATEAKGGAVFGSKNSKNDYLLLQNPMVKGLLNTNMVVYVNPKGKKLETVTAFPELSTSSIINARLVDIREYSSGYEAGLTVEVITEAEGTEDSAKVLQFFDTRYIANFDKYRIGQVYRFHIGALVIKIFHRSRANLTIKLSEEARQTMWKAAGTDQKTISTKHMYALNSAYDDNPEIFNCYTRFAGLHDKSFHYPLLTKEEELYLFEIRCQFFGEDKPLYSLPAIMTDGVIAQSYIEDKANSRRKLQYAEGDPVDITGVLQGYLVES